MDFFISFLFISMLTIYSVFLVSFFPLKQNIPGYADRTWEDKPRNESSDVANTKMVLILVDALRSDFVYNPSSSMKFVSELLENGKAVPFIAKVHPPTVTLPRIKALTTGSIPGFVDVVLNFGSSQLADDNIVSQMLRAGRKIVMFGDDTWLHLFPSHFVRSDGTTSFFVTDYTQVDDNVTRHLETELHNLDFDVMILHYLGLDHIGHIAGPTSPLVAPKLEEMDNVVKLIYQGMKKSADDSLILLCGDHGMSDQGGHGGASYSETRVPVVFMNPKNNYKQEHNNDIPEVEQIDLAPTLSVLMNLPIPKNNLGVMIPDILQGWTEEQKLMATRSNAVQVLNVLQEYKERYQQEEGYLRYQRASKNHEDWLAGNTNLLGSEIQREYSQAIVCMTKEISSSLTQYDMYGLLISVLSLWMMCFAIILRNLTGTFSWSPSHAFNLTMVCFLVIVFCHVTSCTTAIYNSSFLCKLEPQSVVIQFFVLTSFGIFMTEILLQLKNLRGNCKILNRNFPLVFSSLLIGGTAMHSVSLLSSSFVEEEHQTWYFYCMTFHVLILTCLLTSLGYKTFNKETSDEEFDCYTAVDSINLSSNCDNSKQYEMKESNSLQFSRKPIESSNRGDHFKNSKSFLKSVSSVVTVMVLGRILRTWNQTGNKWLNVPDVGDWLVCPENKVFLSVLVLVSVMWVSALKWRHLTVCERVLFMTGIGGVLVYRAETGSIHNPLSTAVISKGILPASSVYILVFLCICKPVMILAFTWILEKVNKPLRITTYLNKDVKMQSIHIGWILLMLLLVKAHNIPLVVMVITQQHLMETIVMKFIGRSVSLLTLYHYWMGMATFFYQGNSNSLSTVDLAAGYIGLEDYQPVIIGVLLTLSTYAGPIFWMISLIKMLVSSSEKEQLTKLLFQTRIKEVSLTLLASRAPTLAMYTSLVTLLRYHLFVWTVFSPKLLYEGMLTVVIVLFLSFVSMVTYLLPVYEIK